MLKCLFVEDEPETVEAVVSILTDMCTCEVKSFDVAVAALGDFLPDIVVLDILNGGASTEAQEAGKDIFDVIWKERFCPIVVYSAQPELLSETQDAHPFVRFVKKGMGSDKQIKESIEEFRPHVEAVRAAEVRIKAVYSIALRDVAEDAFHHYQEPEDRKKAIIRSAQRRVAAFMDDLSRHNEKLQGWEQYLCPPVSEDLTLGEIIRRRDAGSDDPAAFCMVLTPSCDLVATGGRTPKVADVLVACCEGIADGIKKTALGDMGVTKLKSRLPSSLLTPGFLDGIIPLPQLPGRIPSMAANLKRLKLIPLSHITADSADYVRVAAIDSPFRELVSWAYSQTACRLGLPDRDTEAWRDEIIGALNQSGSDGA